MSRPARVLVAVGLLLTRAVPMAADQSVDARRVADADTGEIAGRVVTASGDPVSQASVTLTRHRVDPQPAAVLLRATTNARGEFVFRRLAVGRYTVSAAKPGWTTRRLPETAPGDAQPWSFIPGPTVDVPAGTARVPLDVVMRRSGLIRGRVMNDNGSPARAQVVVAPVGWSGGFRETRVSTDESGWYEIRDLPDGDYFVEATVLVLAVGVVARPSQADRPPAVDLARPSRADPGRETTKAPIDIETTAITAAWYPGVKTPMDAAAVSISEGSALENIDIWVPRDVRTSVVGKVSWPVGVAVEDITLEYGDPSGTQSGMWIVSDPEGRFGLGRVEPGPMTIIALVTTDQGLLMGTASAEVAEGSEQEMYLSVDRPGRVEGRVVFEGAAPMAARPRVVLRQRLVKVSALYPPHESMVGEDGRFAIADVIGDLDVEVTGLPQGWSIADVRLSGRSLGGERLAVRGGEVVSDLQVVVARSR